MIENDEGRPRGPATTRQRILRAAMALHEEVGPAATTISAIARRAEVQRLTVYRHFGDETSLLGACSRAWREGHPFPDPAAWAGEADPARRLEAALRALYGYYARQRRMLSRVLGDEDRVPGLPAATSPYHGYLRELAGQLSAGWGGSRASHRRIRACIGHALRFSTWESLDAEGLAVEEGVGVMAALVRSQA